MAKIIIIDDDEAMRSMLHEAMSDLGHEIVETASSDDAMKAFRKDVTSLIITDIVMPDKNGIDLIMELKRECPEAKIIAMSGGGGIEGRFDYLAIAKLVGAGTVLKKPFTIKELRERVSHVLGDS